MSFWAWVMNPESLSAHLILWTSRARVTTRIPSWRSCSEGSECAAQLLDSRAATFSSWDVPVLGARGTNTAWRELKKTKFLSFGLPLPHPAPLVLWINAISPPSGHLRSGWIFPIFSQPILGRATSSERWHVLALPSLEKELSDSGLWPCPPEGFHVAQALV